MTKLTIYLSIAGGFLLSFLGGWDTLLKAVVIFVILDVLTGLISAIVSRSINSKISYVGLLKKTALFIMVGFANTVDTFLLIDGDGYFRMICVTLILANEGISIIENLAKCGVPIPKKLISFFETLRDQKGEDTSEN